MNLIENRVKQINRMSENASALGAESTEELQCVIAKTFKDELNSIQDIILATHDTDFVYVNFLDIGLNRDAIDNLLAEINAPCESEFDDPRTASQMEDCCN